VTTPPELDLATSLAGRYSIGRELGRGGMATVYLARDLRHERIVALKVLRPDLGAALGPERFAREIKLAASLQHPHILSVFDSGETASGRLWFTMPYVEGESLRDRLRRERQLSVDDALRITREVAGALECAHAHGVLHRDVKPENILLTAQGDALLTDFGIARPLTAATDGTGLTEAGLAVGTPQYMSPEQAAGERTLDARSDVYALGSVCYEMLAGEPPFVGSSAQAIVAKMLTTDAPSVRVLRSGVSPGIDAVLRRALARVPADRWPSAATFAEALGRGERTGATARFAGRRIPAGIALLGFGFLVAVAARFALRHDASSAEMLPVGLAVLPFDNEGDTANAYFAEGITDEIRSKLSALGGLRLIATASSNQYRHTTEPQNQIGRELGVQYLLTGHIQWETSANGTRRVRVSPELIEVESGRPPVTKWQQSYDATLADVFDVQATVATRVAYKLGVVLSAPTETKLAARPTQNLAAYDAYLRSMSLEGQDPATLRHALVAAEQAVARDSGYAAAWARVSVLHSRLYTYSIPTPADAGAARRAADRAVALAPTASEGYYARGVYNILVADDLAATRVAYETAARLAPSSSLALGALGTVDAAEGDWEAGLGHARQAAALDPRSPVAAARLTVVLLYLRRYAEARAEAERGLTIDPSDMALIVNRAASFLGEGDLAGARAALRDVPPTLDRATLAVYVARNHHSYWASHPFGALDKPDRDLVLTLSPAAFDDDRGEWEFVRAELYWLAGDTVPARRNADSARITLETQLRATPGDNYRHLYLGLALAYLGQRAAAVREGERELALILASGDGYRIPYARQVMAQIHLAVGDHPRALEQLDSLLAKPYLVSPAWLKADPIWAPLHGEPRFERLIAQPATGERPRA
jgi:eukaryotic-like serine/threonine-protein kinase